MRPWTSLHNLGRPATIVGMTAHPAPIPDLLTVRETCERLRVSRSTLHNLSRRGELVPVHIGRSVRYRVADVAAYVGNLCFEAVA